MTIFPPTTNTTITIIPSTTPAKIVVVWFRQSRSVHPLSVHPANKREKQLKTSFKDV